MQDPSTVAAPRPEEGAAVVEGIAIGQAVVWADDPVPLSSRGDASQQTVRLERALARATAGVEELVRLLPRAEAELFEPELAILSELGPALIQRVEAGEGAEDCVNDVTSLASTDLLADVRARLLDGLAYGERSVESLLEGHDGDRVLVVSTLTPSIVASLPVRVVGIVTASDDIEAARGAGSHAAILARARDIPLVFVRPQVLAEIQDDQTIVVDATAKPAIVWLAPTPASLFEARGRRSAWARARVEEEESVKAPLTGLGVQIHVNVGSLHEHIPGAAEGIGLLRTELVFTEHRNAPSEAEQFGALWAIAARTGSAPIVVRLFDAGADKPLPWLFCPNGTNARGIELLLMHPAVLDAQLRAIARVAERANVRALLPFVRTAHDVEAIRSRMVSKTDVGAMIESPEAVDRIDDIASVADFVSIGTNDLSAIVTGQDRAGATLTPDRRILRMVERVVRAAHHHDRKVSVCGELASDPHFARILVGLGVDTLSIATGRFAKVKLSLRDLSIDDCRDVASAALSS
jgi:phosphoenolpyruvate-protein kinase (PTS system EI component)